MSKNPVVHFEMPYKDMKRVQEFYSKVFGWGTNETGPEMGNYITVETGPTDPETRMAKEPGFINGGFYDQEQTEYKEPSVVISVEDVNKAMEDIKAAGGEILGDPQNIPGVGLWVSFNDSEGNRVSILQASRGQ